MNKFRKYAVSFTSEPDQDSLSGFAQPAFLQRPVGRFVFALSLLLGTHTGNVIAGPEGGQIAGGQGTISTPNATTTVINQNTQNLAIEWQTYNVSANELVEYIQPNKSATALNKIFDANPSQIFGTIKANGQIVLVNPNGVYFKPGATVSVGSLVASGLDVNTQDFMDGKYTFNAPDGSSGMVINQGVLQAATGGSINLIGRSVQNEGVILAHAGQVNMVAGDKITMDFDGDGLMRFVVDKAVLENAQDLDDAIKNDGTIEAEGGSVLLSASASKDVFTNAINNSGVIKAGRIDKSGGKIRLVGTGAGSSIINTGTITASTEAVNEDGGSIEITADNITSSGTITAESVSGSGGEINIESNDTTLLTENSVVSVASDLQQGGVAKILGDKVGLVDNAVVDASGATGGGEVLVGGDVMGQNAEVKNASAVYVGHHVEISADATSNGDGGKIVIFSEDSTKIAGNISARGGDEGGDGGFVETSGKKGFIIDGHPDVNAPNGEGGHWLIDPNNITIVADGAGPTNNITPAGNMFTSNDDGAILEVDDIEGVLTGNNTVEIITGTDGDGPDLGDITLSTALDFDDGAAGEGTLIFNAINDININGTISDGSPGSDFIDLILHADSDGSGAGSISITQAITLNGGDINLIGNAFSITAVVDVNDGGSSNQGRDGDIFIARSDTGAADTLTLGTDISQTSLNNLRNSRNMVLGEATDSASATVSNDVVTVGSAIDFTAITNPPTSVTLKGSSNINIDGATTASVLTLDTAGTAAQSAEIITTTLNLDDSSAGGAAVFTLDDADNNITTLDADANTLAAVTFREDADGFDVAGINATTVTLDSDQTVTDSGAITATTLNLNGSGGAGTFTLDFTGHDITTLDADTDNLTAVTFRDDATGFDVAGIDATTVTLDSDDTVTDSGAIDATTLNLNSTGGGGTYTLDFTGHDITDLDADANALTALTFRDDASGFNILGINATNTISLDSDDTVTQSGVITTNVLTLLNGTFDLDDANNDVVSLDANNTTLGGNLAYRNDTIFSIAGIDAGGNDVSLTSTSTVSQTAAIIADHLSLLGVGSDYDLTNASNDVTTLEADANQITELTFRDNGSGFDVAGINATGTVILDSDDTVTDSDGIVAGILDLRDTSASGTAIFTLDDATHNITTLDADTNTLAAVTFREDNDGFAVSGIDATGGTVTLDSNQTVTDTGNITATTLNLLGTGGAGTFTLDATGHDITTLDADANALTAVTFRDDATGFDVAGINATTVTLDSDDTVTDSGNITATTLNLNSSGGGGTYTLNSTGHDITTLDADANALTALTFRDDATGFDVAGINATTVTLDSDDTVTDSGAIVATTLNLNSTLTGATYTFNNTGHNITDLDADANQITGLTFRDNTGGFNVLGINATGSVTLDSDDTVTDGGSIIANTLNLIDTSASGTATFTLNNTGHDVSTLEADANQITGLTFRDNATGFDIAGINATGTVTLDSDDTVTDSDGIIAGTLDLRDTSISGTAIFTLNDSSNDVTTLDADANTLASVTFRDDVTGFDVAGIDAAGGTVTLDSDDTVTDTGNITATTLNLNSTAGGGTYTLNSTGHDVTDLDADANTLTALTFRDDATGFNILGIDATGGTVTLDSDDTVTDSGNITATTLNLNSTGGGGNYTLNSTGHDVTNLDADTNTLGNLTFRDDATGFNITGIDSGGTVTLQSDDTVSQSGNNITATTLVLQSSGTYNFTDNTNDVDNLEASGTSNIDLHDADGVDIGAGNVAAASLSLTTNGGDITDTGTVTITGTTSLNAGAAGNINLNNTGNDFDSDDNGDELTVTNANNVTIDEANTVTLGNVTSQGNQTYDADVKLAGDTVLDSSGGGGDIDFHGTIDGTTDFAQDLTITAGTGNVTINGAVGQTNDLDDVNITSSASVTIDTGAATPGANAAATTDTFLADSLRARSTGLIDIGGNGDGDVILRGNGGGNVLDIESTLAANAPGIEFNASVLLTAGNVLLNTTANNTDIVMTTDGLTEAATPAERILSTPGDVTITVGGGNAQTILNDARTGGTPTVPGTGSNTVVSGGTVAIDNLVTGTNLDDGAFPQVLANTISVTYDGNLELGTDAVGSIAAANSLDDSQMDGLLSGGATSLIITVNMLGGDNGDVVLDRQTTFGANDFNLTANGYITDNSNGLAFQSTGLLTLQSGSSIGLDNTPGGNTGGSLTIDVNNTITITDAAASAVHITNNASAGDATYIVDSAAAGSITDVTIVQDANDVLINEINASGKVAISSAGAIVDNDDTDIDINSTQAHLVAVSGIADGDELTINVTDATNGLAATTASGDINIFDSAGGFGIGTITTDFDDAGATTVMTDGASITTGSAGDDIRIRSITLLNVSQDVTNAGGGDITLAAEGTAGSDDLTVNGANVTASGGNGNVELFGGSEVILLGLSQISAANAGTIDIFAGRDFANGTPAAGFANGAILGSSGSVVQQLDGGTITMAARGDVNVDQVTSTGGTVNITAGDDTFAADTDGEIIDNNAAANNVTASSVVLTADTGIGLDTAVDNLTADNITSGNIDIDEADDVVLVTTFRNQVTNGTLDLSTTDGSIDTSTVAVSTQDGAITLTASDAGANNDRSITVGAGGIDSNGAGTGNITLNAADGVALGGNVDAGPDNVTIDANNAAADVGGADTNGAITHSAGTLTGTTIDLDAAEGIVAVTAGSSISADNTTSGDVDIDNALAAAVTVTTLTTAGGGNILFDNTGAGGVTFETVTATQDGTPVDGESDVTLTSSGGGDLNISGGTATVAAGVSEGDVNITVNGDANFDMATGTAAITAGEDVIINSSGDISLHDVTSDELIVNVDTNNNGTNILTLGAGTLNIDSGGSTILASGGTDDNDTLVGQNTANTWVITAANDGVLNPTGTDFLTFTQFGTISGATSMVDTIDQSSVDIDGAGGVPPAGDITVVLSSEGTNDGMAGSITGLITFDDIDAIDNDDDANNTITGAPTAAISDATWTIDGGTENYSDNGSGQDLDFSSTFTTLNGGSGNDKFDIDANYTADISGGDGVDEFEFSDSVTLTGTIDGGDGVDVLDVQNVTAAVVTVAGGGTTDGSKGDITATTDPINKGAATDDFDNIDTVEGGVGGFLTGPDVDTIWRIDGVGSGTYGENGDETAFANFTITGGNQADTFLFVAGGRLSSVDGGALGEGNTLIPFTPAGFGQEYTITGDGQGQDNSVASDMFTGGGTEFTNIDILFGNNNADVFTVNDGVSWSGTFIGGTQAGTASAAGDTIIFNNTTPVTWLVTGAGTRPEVYDSNDVSVAGTVVVGDIDAGDAAVDGSGGSATGSGFNFLEFEILTSFTANDIFNIQALDNDLTINAGSGDDTFNISSNAPTNTSSLDDILAILTLRGDADTDTLNISDSGDTDADTGELTDTEITGIFGTGAAGHKVDYNDGGASEIENINIDLGSGDDMFDVTDVAMSSTVVLNTNGGDDTVDIGGAANSLDGILGTLTVNGGAPAGAVGDTLIVNDAGDNTGTIYSIDAGNINRAGIIPISYSNFEQLDLLTGSGNDSITANGWSSVTGNVTDAGPADMDTFTVNTAFSVTGDFAITNIETLNNFPVPSAKALGADTLTISGADTIGSAADPFDISVNTLITTGIGGTGGSFFDNTGGSLDIDIDATFGTNFSLDNGGNALKITGTNGLDVSTGNVEIINVGNITQDQTVTVGNFFFDSTGAVTLTDMANVMNAIAGNTTGGNVNLTYQNTSVSAFATPRGTGASGIDTNGGDLTLTAKSVTNSTNITADTETNGGNVTIDGGVNVNNATLDAGTGDLALSTVDNNESVQTSGTGLIVGDALSVNSRRTDVDTDINSFSGVSTELFISVNNTGGGALTLNSVDTSAVNSSIQITNDAGNIVIANDLNSGAGNVLLTTTTSGDINNGGGTVTGDFVVFDAAGGIGITGGPVVTDVSGTTSSSRDFRSNGAGAAGNININDVNSFDVSTLFFSTAASGQTATIQSNGGAGTITINEAASGDDGLDNNDTLVLDGNINVTTNTVSTAGGLANLIYDGNTTLAGGNTSFTVGNLRFGGSVNTGGSNLQVNGTGNVGLNGDIVNAGILDFTGINVVVESDTTLESNANDIRFAAGGISGTGALQLTPNAIGETVAISTGTPADLNFNPNVFTAFGGHLVLGGTLTPATLPFNPATATVIADTVTIEAPLNMPGAQGLTLLGSGIILDTTGINVGGVGGGAFNAFAVGNTCLVCAGLTQDGNITSNQNVTIQAGSGILVAEGTIENAASFDLNFGGGDVQIALGADEDNAQNLSGNANGAELSPEVDNFINNILGLTVNAVIVSFFNPASALIGLQEVAFVDVGLFEEELSLFGTIGNGIALALAQCEEIEGCAPNVTEEELVELIAGLEGRIEELERRLADEADPSERLRLEELIAGYREELDNFRQYQQDLIAFFSAEEEEFEEDFEEEDFGDEFGDEEVPAGPPDVQTVETLAEMLKVVNARIEWLESLKDDPEERARLSEITGIDLTKEALDAIIEGARFEAGYIENQLKLLLEGKEARQGRPDKQPLFTNNDNGMEAVQIAYGPSSLELNAATTTLN